MRVLAELVAEAQSRDIGELQATGIRGGGGRIWQAAPLRAAIETVFVEG